MNVRTLCRMGPYAMFAGAVCSSAALGDLIVDEFPWCFDSEQTAAKGVSPEGTHAAGQFIVTQVYDEKMDLIGFVPCFYDPDDEGGWFCDEEIDPKICAIFPGNSYFAQMWGYLWERGEDPTILAPLNHPIEFLWNMGSNANDTSASGGVTVGSSTRIQSTTSHSVATRWVNGAPAALKADPWDDDFDSYALSVSSDGSVIVGYAQYVPLLGPSWTRPLRWESGTMTIITNLGDAATGNAVSPDGTMMVGLTSGDPYLRYEDVSPAVNVTLPFPADTLSVDVHAVSDGEYPVVVGSRTVPSSIDLRAVRWVWDTVEEQWVVIELDFTTVCEQVYGSSSPNCDNGEYADVDFYPESVANGVSADGSIITGWVRGLGGPTRVFMWDEINGVQVLAETDNMKAAALSADGGTVVGGFVGGKWRGWALDLPSDSCPGDLNDDGVVDTSDLIILLGEWGTCADPENCPADLNSDGVVDGSDLNILLSLWGPCP